MLLLIDCKDHMLLSRSLSIVNNANNGGAETDKKIEVSKQLASNTVRSDCSVVYSQGGGGSFIDYGDVGKEGVTSIVLLD